MKVKYAAPEAVLKQETANGFWLKVLAGIAVMSFGSGVAAVISMGKTLSMIDTKVSYLTIALDRNQMKFETYVQDANKTNNEIDRRIDTVEKALARKGLI